MEQQDASVLNTRYVRVCRQYRDLCEECAALIARRVSSSELTAAIEWKCRRLGELIKELKQRN